MFKIYEIMLLEYGPNPNKSKQIKPILLYFYMTGDILLSSLLCLFCSHICSYLTIYCATLIMLPIIINTTITSLLVFTSSHRIPYMLLNNCTRYLTISSK